jgi:hypothetical protein
MAIYDIFDKNETPDEVAGKRPFTTKDRLFSSLTTRILFLLLFFADIAWAGYAVVLYCLGIALTFATLFQWRLPKRIVRKQWMNLKRSGVCGVSLFVSLFSPALGIMIACTYFLMYDKDGIQEVVPTSLQEQFQEFLK